MPWDGLVLISVRRCQLRVFPQELWKRIGENGKLESDWMFDLSLVVVMSCHSFGWCRNAGAGREFCATDCGGSLIALTRPRDLSWASTDTGKGKHAASSC